MSQTFNFTKRNSHLMCICWKIQKLQSSWNHSALFSLEIKIVHPETECDANSLLGIKWIWKSNFDVLFYGNERHLLLMQYVSISSLGKCSNFTGRKKGEDGGVVFVRCCDGSSIDSVQFNCWESQYVDKAFDLLRLLSAFYSNDDDWWEVLLCFNKKMLIFHGYFLK